MNDVRLENLESRCVDLRPARLHRTLVEDRVWLLTVSDSQRLIRVRLNRAATSRRGR